VRGSDTSANIRNISAFAVGLTLIIYSRVGKWPWGLSRYLADAFAHYGLISVDFVDPTSQALVFLLTGAALILLTFAWERNSASSLGLSSPYVGDLLLAVSAWLLYQLINRFIYDFHLYTPGTHTGLGDSEVFFSLPARWSITLLVLDVVFEELATRTYVIERMISFTGSHVLAGMVSLVLSISLHIPGRDVWQALHRMPSMSLLTGLYVWRRSIIPCVLTHVPMDVAMFLVLFHFPWLLVWVIPQRRVAILFTVSMLAWICVQSIRPVLGRTGI
jgi:hypothetical protein